jgi:hypothetical protein
LHKVKEPLLPDGTAVFLVPEMGEYRAIEQDGLIRIFALNLY